MSGLLLCLALIGANPLQEPGQRVRPVPSEAGIVSSQEALASAAGAAILAKGGNAIDAAVATAYALAVTLPQAGNLGGGGFLVFWNQPERRGYALNFREMAPRRAHKDLFLGADGRVDRQLATRSLLSTGVPGTVAGLLKAQERFGALSRSEVMAPAIRLAEQGFAVYPVLEDSLKRAAPLLQADPAPKPFITRAAESPIALARSCGSRCWRPPCGASLSRAALAFIKGLWLSSSKR